MTPTVLKDFHHKIFEVFEKFADFDKFNINVFGSKTARKRQYLTVSLPSNPETVKEIMLGLSIQKSRTIHFYERVLEIILTSPSLKCCFIFAEKDVKCQKVTKTPDKIEFSLILD